jgi:hypothetical protein
MADVPLRVEVGDIQLSVLIRADRFLSVAIGV